MLRQRAQDAALPPTSAANFGACAARASRPAPQSGLDRLAALGQPMAPMPTNPILAFTVPFLLEAKSGIRCRPETTLTTIQMKDRRFGG
jgi:hypothetical protein